MPNINQIKIGSTTYDIIANLPYVEYSADAGYGFQTPVGILESLTVFGGFSIYETLEVSADLGITITGAPIMSDSAITTTGPITGYSFNATSDRRLKENIIDTEIDYGAILDNLHIVDFNFKSDKDKKVNVGLIAQELQEILPDKYKAAIVVENPATGYLSINESKLVYIALLALKDQKKQIADLEARLQVLENN